MILDVFSLEPTKEVWDNPEKKKKKKTTKVDFWENVIKAWSH